MEQETAYLAALEAAKQYGFNGATMDSPTPTDTARRFARG